MLNALTLILCFQLAGELAAGAFGLGVPGPVIGMALLFGFLLARGSVPDELGRAGDFLIGHLSLLFVPAGVGVMLHFRLLESDWLAISVALVVSTVLTIIVTAWMMVWLRPVAPGSESPEPEPPEPR